jgi:EamA domain-containing membrane protein RarD
LSRSNIVAILFAAAGLAYYMIATATIPWVGLGVGVTFALYGLLRKPMTTVGILFYVTPTLQFLCGVLVLGEAFSFDKLVAFIGIWTGIAIFCYSLIAGKGSAKSA